MTSKSKASDLELAEARLDALQEATEQARRIAQAWRDEAEGNHSSQHSNLRRIWADAAERVADAIEALAQHDEADEPEARRLPQHNRPHHL